MEELQLEEDKLRQTIAENLIYYRKYNNYTQAKLAEVLNYSDKAISKWERGDGIPDVIILKKLADLYHITVNDLLSTKKKKQHVPFFKNRIIFNSSIIKKSTYTFITFLSIGIAWLTAIVAFSILLMIENNINATWNWLWLFFIYPIPVSFVIALVFAKIWGKRWYRFFIVTGIIFGTGLAIFCQLIVFPDIVNPWIIWLVCIPIEVLNILWYSLTRKKKDLE